MTVWTLAAIVVGVLVVLNVVIVVLLDLASRSREQSLTQR